MTKLIFVFKNSLWFPLLFITTLTLGQSTQNIPKTRQFNQQMLPPNETNVTTLVTPGFLGKDPVEETLRLLQQGDEQIELRETHRDLILVIGNTGAGKTTMAKFLTTDNRDMMAYDEDGRILIRDLANKISTNGTVISKTIFPELMIQRETNTSFYDLPGFSDTRSPSIEIANAFFMKKVADHARRVKLLFIVNHSSLRPGETRNDFKNLIHHSTTFIKNSAKFEPAIALIATKVETAGSYEKIVENIGKFLVKFRGNIPGVISNLTIQENSINLVNAFLSKNQTGEYNRIGFFRQPEEEGPLSENSMVQSIKRKLENMIHNIQFVDSTPRDFGFSVTAEAKLLIYTLTTKVNQKLNDLSVELATKVQGHYDTQIGETTTSQNLILKLTRDQKILANATRVMSKTETREEFFKILGHTLTTLNIQGVTSIDEELKKCNAHLTFFEQVMQISIPAKNLELIRPLEEVTQTLSQSIGNAIHTLNSELKNVTTAIGNELQQIIVQKVTKAQDMKKLHQNFERDFQKLSDLSSSLLTCGTLDKFVVMILQELKSLYLLVPQSYLTPLAGFKVNLNLVNLKPEVWVKPLEETLLFLQSHMMTLQMTFTEQEYQKNLTEMSSQMIELQQEMNRTIQDANDKITRMEANHKLEVKGLQGNLTFLNDNLKKVNLVMKMERQNFTSQLAQRQREYQNKLKVEEERQRQKDAAQLAKDQARDAREAREKEEQRKAQVKKEEDHRLELARQKREMEAKEAERKKREDARIAEERRLAEIQRANEKKEAAEAAAKERKALQTQLEAESRNTQFYKTSTTTQPPKRYSQIAVHGRLCVSECTGSTSSGYECVTDDGLTDHCSPRPGTDRYGTTCTTECKWELDITNRYNGYYWCRVTGNWYGCGKFVEVS